MSPRHAVYVQDYILRRGGDPNAIFAAADWELPVDAEQHKPIPIANMSRIFEEAARMLEGPDFGMHTAEFFPYESSGMMTLAILAASNLEQALQMLTCYGKHIDSGFHVTTTQREDGIRIEFKLLDPLDTPGDQLREYLLALFLQLVRTGTKKDINPLSASFSVDEGRNRASLRKFFACPLEFGSANALVFHRDVLKEKFVTAHHLLFDMLAKAMQSLFRSDPEERDLMSLVSREIIKHTSVESLSLEKVAEELSMSPRTLRRKLAAASTSWPQSCQDSILFSESRRRSTPVMAISHQELCACPNFRVYPCLAA